jgi:hypothetical protein
MHCKLSSAVCLCFLAFLEAAVEITKRHVHVYSVKKKKTKTKKTDDTSVHALIFFPSDYINCGSFAMGLFITCVVHVTLFS